MVSSNRGMSFGFGVGMATGVLIGVEVNIRSDGDETGPFWPTEYCGGAGGGGICVGDDAR